MKIQLNKFSFLFVTIVIFALSFDIYSSENETELSIEERKEILEGFYTEIETLKREYLRIEVVLKGLWQKYLELVKKSLLPCLTFSNKINLHLNMTTHRNPDLKSKGKN